MAVLLPMKVAAIFSLVGGMSQTAVLMLFGIHSAKEEQFFTFNAGPVGIIPYAGL